jgi:serine phosphatase RsbU (regulator of sigma subunit)/CheY-like chemotaxis protein
MATVLVVDDDPISRAFLRTLLDYRGHDMCEAADGDSALTLAGRQPLDAVITDVLMPGLDGYELARMLRSRPATSRIPIAFSTAHYGRDEILPLALACGVRDVIFKPALPTEVLATIDALLMTDRTAEHPADRTAQDSTDGSAHRRADRAEALGLSVGRLRAIGATAAVGVLLADSRASAYYVNPRLAQIIGRSEASLLGLGWLDGIEPAGRARLLAAVEAGTIRDGRPHRVAHIQPAGAYPRWLDICLYPVTDAAGSDIIGIVAGLDGRAPIQSVPPATGESADLLRRQAAYLANRLAETHYLTQSGTWDLDLATDTVVVSPFLRDLLHLPSVHLSLEQLRQCVHPDDLARIVALAEHTGSGEAPMIAELRIAGADGAMHELLVSYRVARSAESSGKASATPTVWGVAQDVTHIRRAERAQVHTRMTWSIERSLVDDFHRAMLPPALPQAAGMDVGACYLTAPDRLDVGTGWYDALAMPDGRLLLSVGEVAGHDHLASAVVGPVRAVLRAYGLEDPDPTAVLARLNGFLARAGHEGTYVTAVVALYEPHANLLSLANAGHPAPMLLSPDGEGPTARPLVHTDPALGILPDPAFTRQELTLAPGSALLLYTDGLTDRHGDPEATGTQRLAKVAARGFRHLAPDGGQMRPTAQHLAELVVQNMLDGQAPDDDICVAVLWTAAGRQGAAGGAGHHGADDE